jgi:hypothetical protein
MDAGKNQAMNRHSANSANSAKTTIWQWQTDSAKILIRIWQWQSRTKPRAQIQMNTTPHKDGRLLGEAIKAGKITKDAKGKLEVSTGINKPLDTITTSQSHSPFRSETDWTGLDK